MDKTNPYEKFDSTMDILDRFGKALNALETVADWFREVLSECARVMKALADRLTKHFKTYFSFDTGELIFVPRRKKKGLRPYYPLPVYNYRPSVRKNEPYMRRRNS